MPEEEKPHKLYLDTNIFCATFESDGRSNHDLRAIFKMLEQRPKTAATSELTLAELLGVKSPSLDWDEQKRLYSNLLTSTGFIELHPVSREVLIDTADDRRVAHTVGRQVRLPDAIHAVTATRSSCRYLVMADNRFAVPDRLERVALDPVGIAFLKNLLDA